MTELHVDKDARKRGIASTLLRMAAEGGLDPLSPRGEVSCARGHARSRARR